MPSDLAALDAFVAAIHEAERKGTRKYNPVQPALFYRRQPGECVKILHATDDADARWLTSELLRLGAVVESMKGEAA